MSWPIVMAMFCVIMKGNGSNAARGSGRIGHPLLLPVLPDPMSANDRVTIIPHLLTDSNIQDSGLWKDQVNRGVGRVEVGPEVAGGVVAVEDVDKAVASIMRYPTG